MNAVDCNLALRRVGQYLARLRPTDTVNRATTLWKAGMLSGAKTHLGNVLGNLSMQALEASTDPVGLVTDYLYSRVTGNRTRTWNPPLVDQVKGAVQDFRDTLRTGQSSVSGKWDAQNADYGPSVPGRLTSGYVNFVFRTLNAEDALFSKFAMDQSISRQARVMARNEGRVGAAFTNRVRNLEAAPTGEMADHALMDAQWMTFQNSNALSDLWKRGLRGAPAPLRVAANIAVPFTTVPTNIALRAAEYSPAGVVKALASDLPKGDQAAFVQSFSRGVTGTGLIAAGWLLHKKGLMTADSPPGSSGKQQRADDAAEGRQAGSVKIGKRWVAVEKLGPFGVLADYGANLAQMAEEGNLVHDTAPEIGQSAIRMAMKGISTIAKGTILPDVAEAADAISSGEGGLDAATHVLQTKAGSLVPGAVSTLAQMADPTVRNQYEEPLGPIKSRIPLVSRSLPPRFDSFGGEVQRGGPLSALSPLPVSQEKRPGDPLFAKLRDLNLKVGLPKPTATVSTGQDFPSRTSVKMSDDTYGSFMRDYGPKLQNRLRAYLTDLTPQEETDLLNSAGSDAEERSVLQDFIQQRQTDLNDPAFTKPMVKKYVQEVIINKAREEWKAKNEERLRRDRVTTAKRKDDSENRALSGLR